MKTVWQQLLKGLDEICFPPVCLACGVQRTMLRQYLCPLCLTRGFEEANPDDRHNASGEILPEGVGFQDALWRYHKSGVLQHLMYHLKYDHKALLGRELGALTALRFQKRAFAKQWLLQADQLRIVPVPLHPSKLRIRGFNQARYIALGVREILDIQVLKEGLVRRKKFTGTQTEFSLKERMHNMQAAFKIECEKSIKESCHLIVDDVFTTGTTVFEMAHQLIKAGSKGVGILTVAQA